MSIEKYIPKNYTYLSNNQFKIIYDSSSQIDEISSILSTISKSINKFKKYFSIPANYNIHFIVYNTERDFFDITGKHISNTSLCVLYADQKQSLVSMFSSLENEINGNQRRQSFHILHELSHIWITILTKSNRELSNNNENLKLPIWLDEGVSEFIALSITNNQLQITNCINACCNNDNKEIVETMQFDFYGKDSSKHYIIATGLVAFLYGNNELHKHSLQKMIMKFVYQLLRP